MRYNIQIVCLLAVLPLALCWQARVVPALDQTNPAGRTAAPTPAGFQAFLQSLWPLAEEKRIARGTFDAAFAGLAQDPALFAASNRQAEFDKPLKSYLDEAVSPRRRARGRECLRAWHAELSKFEQRLAYQQELSSRPSASRRILGKQKLRKTLSARSRPWLIPADQMPHDSWMSTVS